VLQNIIGAIPQNLKNNKLYSTLRESYMKLLENKVSALYEEYSEIMQPFRDFHNGERVFIVGTGPSLNETPLHLLEGENVIGVNTLYRTSIKCKYYVVSDGVVFAKHWRDILRQDCNVFLTSTAGFEYLANKRKYEKFKREWLTIPYQSSIQIDTVIIACIGLAMFMGFSEIYLLGCDFDYSGPKEHFDGAKVTTKTMAYITGDFTDIFTTFEMLDMAALTCGKKIYNATPGGKLEVFERRKLEDLFSNDLKTG